MLKLIIFDFDGTMVDSKAVFLRTYNLLSEKYQVKKIENAHDIQKIPLQERFKVLDFPRYKVPFFVQELRKHYQKALGEILLVSGIREVILSLKQQGYTLAIISSNEKGIIAEYLKSNQLDVFEIIMSSNIFGKDKVIKKLLNSQKLTPGEVIYIGDETRDISACKKAGIRILCVNWGYDVDEVLKAEKPDYIVGSPQEILAVSKALAGSE